MILIAILAVGGAAIFLIQKRSKKFSRRERELIAREWESIGQKVDKEPKHALIEADKLLDFALKRKGYAGSLGDKLKAAHCLFTRSDEVWEAHKLRNRAAHEVGFSVNEEQARKAISSIKKALWDLGLPL